MGFFYWTPAPSQLYSRDAPTGRQRDAVAL
jgi:hypothetical protein